jgi:hypothetical protein
MMEAQRRRFAELLKLHGVEAVAEAVDWTIGAGFSQLVLRRENGGYPGVDTAKKTVVKGGQSQW